MAMPGGLTMGFALDLVANVKGFEDTMTSWRKKRGALTAAVSQLVAIKFLPVTSPNADRFS